MMKAKRLAAAFLSTAMSISALGLTGLFAVESANPKPWNDLKKLHCYYYVPDTMFSKLSCAYNPRATLFDAFSAHGRKAWKRTIAAGKCARQFNTYDRRGNRVHHPRLSPNWRTEKSAKWACVKAH